MQKKTNKNKKGFNFFHIFIALIIFSGILGGSYILYNNVLKPQYTIQFVDAEGIEYGDYPSITVKSGDSFTFTVTVNEGLSYYPQFNGITANGKKLEKIDDIYKVKVFSNLAIVANGWGTAGLIFDETNLVTGVNASKVVIPYGVTNVNPGAFNSFNSIVEVTIPSSVLELGSLAFENCANLSKINISNNTIVNMECFSGTAWLNSQPNGVVYIGSCAYTYKGTMSNGTIIEIAPGTKYISPRAFERKSAIVGVTLPNSIEKIGDLSFYQCSNLTNIIVGDSIKSIGVFAFDETAWLNNQPNGLTYIGNWFYKYKYIGELKPGFQANLRADTIGIAGGAFEPVKIVLTEVSLPNGLKYIEKNAFQGCHFLENITLPETILSIGEYAFENSGIEEAILPKNLKYLGSYVFMNCNYLLNVTIPEGVTKINPRSFAFCAQLKEVNIYSRLERIGTEVFLLCQQLESIIFYSNTVPKITPTTFVFQDIVPENLKIYVPEINVEKFKSAGGWSVFIQNIFPWSV